MMDDLENRIRQALLDARQALALGEVGTLENRLARLRSEVETAQFADEERRRLIELCDAGLKRVARAMKRRSPTT
ncbi:hypothetical protein [Nocardia sp. SYP-A9097]|uniref:hypothetical protein n=1 Tax=Nocardia sp. SYP-A9097 TaxID=2663237 RepID=UPI001E591F7C|nr:hypothetical protein [Nocardia sp. SYP-A9097]